MISLEGMCIRMEFRGIYQLLGCSFYCLSVDNNDKGSAQN